MGSKIRPGGNRPGLPKPQFQISPLEEEPKGSRPRLECHNAHRPIKRSVHERSSERVSPSIKPAAHVETYFPIQLVREH